ncbi:MAG: DNA-processing protein DprA [Candidatus Tectomicrobia bacterium]|nr:DNA-processing protein DprA [Candidatus Tectomicrobia bacterium]
MNIIHLSQDDPRYPPPLKIYLGDRAPAFIAALGNLDILQHKTLALFCSVKCPGDLILQTYDLAHHLRRNGVTILGGFHSPMERECLTVLLRGTQPIILCSARSIVGMQIRAEYRKPLIEGRLLFLSPFVEKQRRATVHMALYRNQFVAALADQIFVAYAEPLSKTERFCREILAWRKPLYTLESNANTNLITLGAELVRLDTLAEWV